MAKGLVEQSTMTAIADAIRAKNGTEDTYTPAQMADAITSGGGDSVYTSPISHKGTYLSGTFDFRGTSSNNQQVTQLNIVVDGKISDFGSMILSGSPVGSNYSGLCEALVIIAKEDGENNIQIYDNQLASSSYSIELDLSEYTDSHEIIIIIGGFSRYSNTTKGDYASFVFKNPISDYRYAVAQSSYINTKVYENSVQTIDANGYLTTTIDREEKILVDTEGGAF